MRLYSGQVASAALAAILLTSCSSSKTKTTAPVRTTLPPPASIEELEARLVALVPGEFTLQPDDVGDTGPSDLAKAVRDYGSPGAEQALRSEGFVRGYQRLWIGPGDAEIIVFLYQFETPAGADAHFERARANLTAVAPPGATTFIVNGIPPSQSMTVAGSSTDLSAAIVLFASGVFNVQVVCNGPELTDLQARASAVAKDQYDRL
jgi:hypothetical protein